jgi:hypothetical protein
MPLVGDGQLAERRLLSQRGVVVFLAIMALTVSLADRVPHAVSVNKASAAHASSPAGKIQHRDQDESRWAALPPAFTLLWASETSVPLVEDKKVAVPQQDNSLHNRPPPVS